MGGSVLLGEVRDSEHYSILTIETIDSIEKIGSIGSIGSIDSIVAYFLEKLEQRKGQLVTDKAKKPDGSREILDGDIVWYR